MRKRPAPPRWFTRLGLVNWKNFTKVEVALQQRVFLVGPNASGKSNLLDVFRFLRDLVAVGGGFQEAVQRRGGVSKLRCLAARRTSDLSVSIGVGNPEAPQEWEYELSFNRDARSRPIIKRERVVHDGRVLLDRPDDKDEADLDRLTQTYLEQVYTNQEFRELAAFLQSVEYLHVVPQLIREPDRSVGKTEDPFGGDFLERIASAQEKTRMAWLRRIRDALTVAVPQLKELELHRDDRGVPHLRGRYEHWRPRGAWQDEDQFSDGTLRLMGLLWITLASHGPLLLEEPELSLHPGVVGFLPQMFSRLQRRTGRQVMVSTHSPEMLADSGIGLDEVFLLQPGTEGTSVHLATTIDEARPLLEGGQSLADIVLPRTRPPRADQLTLFGE